MKRSGIAIDEAGKLPFYIERNGRSLYVVTVFAKYIYDTIDNAHILQRIITACLPNGLLQSKYNPDENNTVWRTGRDAPTLGEDFRVRISLADLRAKASWRVQEIHVPRLSI